MRAGRLGWDLCRTVRQTWVRPGAGRHVNIPPAFLPIWPWRRPNTAAPAVTFRPADPARITRWSRRIIDRTRFPPHAGADRQIGRLALDTSWLRPLPIRRDRPRAIGSSLPPPTQRSVVSGGRARQRFVVFATMARGEVLIGSATAYGGSSGAVKPEGKRAVGRNDCAVTSRIVPPN
jgi:hypothetical protein